MSEQRLLQVSDLLFTFQMQRCDQVDAHHGHIFNFRWAEFAHDWSRHGRRPVKNNLNEQLIKIEWMFVWLLQMDFFFGVAYNLRSSAQCCFKYFLAFSLTTLSWTKPCGGKTCLPLYKSVGFLYSALSYCFHSCATTLTSIGFRFAVSNLFCGLMNKLIKFQYICMIFFCSKYLLHGEFLQLFHNFQCILSRQRITAIVITKRIE